MSHRYPKSAPLALRLPEEVYSLDGCVTGPPVGRPHRHDVRCDTSYDAGHRHSVGSAYMVAPGARLEVGPRGKLYESMGATGSNRAVLGIAALGAAAVLYIILKKKR
jgi:hypothetical protein